MTITTVAADQVSIPTAAGVQHFTCNVTGGVLHITVSRDPLGNNPVVATSFAPSGVSANYLNTAISTVGAGTLTAAALLGGVITRSGSVAAYSDTTDTAALIQAAWTGSVGSAFMFTIKNTVAFPETIVGGTGVTLAGQTVIPALSAGNFLAVWTGTNTITITGMSVTSLAGLPDVQLSTTLNATTGSLPAGAITGAKDVTLVSTNATPGAQLVRTAAQMLADTPNGQVGYSWRFRIVNTGAGTLTLTTDAGTTVTLSGTMTVLQNTWRDFIATFTAAATATITTVGTGTYS